MAASDVELKSVDSAIETVLNETGRSIRNTSYFVMIISEAATLAHRRVKGPQSQPSPAAGVLSARTALHRRSRCSDWLGADPIASFSVGGRWESEMNEEVFK